MGVGEKKVWTARFVVLECVWYGDKWSGRGRVTCGGRRGHLSGASPHSSAVVHGGCEPATPPCPRSFFLALPFVLR